MSVKDGPGEGTWSVFAQKVVEERDDARAENAQLRQEYENLIGAAAKRDVAMRQTIEGIARTLAATVNGWPYEQDPVLHVSQAVKLACDTIDDLRAENERLRAEVADERAESERLRTALDAVMGACGPACCADCDAYYVAKKALDATKEKP